MYAIFASENAIVPTSELPEVARRVNAAHQSAMSHAKSMLVEARNAGNALLQAKELLAHGDFKSWVASNCRCSYQTASRYMQVARIAQAENLTLETFDGGVSSFLRKHSSRAGRTETRAHFDAAAAKRTLQLAALAEQGIEGERAAAQHHLEVWANRFGLSVNRAVQQARSQLSDWELSADVIKTREQMQREQERANTPFGRLPSDGAAYHFRQQKLGEMRKLSKAELLNMLADRIVLEQFSRKDA